MAKWRVKDGLSRFVLGYKSQDMPFLEKVIPQNRKGREKERRERENERGERLGKEEKGKLWKRRKMRL